MTNRPVSLQYCNRPLSLPGKAAAGVTAVAITGIVDASAVAPADTELTLPTLLLGLAVAIILVQGIIIAAIQLSRSRYKQEQEALMQAQKELETGLKERTRKQEATNEQLKQEVSRHEFTEALLHETKEYLDSIINSMPSVLIGVTPTGYVTHWNQSAQSATGITNDQALGRKLDEVYPALQVSTTMIRDAIRHRTPQITENIQQGEGMDATFTDVTVYPLLSHELTGAVIRVDDVTMRVHLENTMIQNEKMASLGELAAGMAHEINNPLSVILQGIQNILRRTSGELKKNHRIAEECGTDLQSINDYLNQREIFQFLYGIREAGERAASIVTNMLEFSRNNNRRHEPTDLRELLNQSLALALNTVDLKSDFHFKMIRVEKDYDPALPKVPCNPAEIQQIILNLLKNSAQALAQDGGDQQPPTITLRTRQVGDSAQIEVEDNGPGMAATVTRRIFEPFYTTKGVGQGTGLGLSVSYFIITEHHGGTLNVESTPGQGAKFIIRLPLSDRAPRQRTASNAAAPTN